MTDYLRETHLNTCGFSLRSFSSISILIRSWQSPNVRPLFFFIGSFLGTVLLFKWIQKFLIRGLTRPFHALLKDLFRVSLEGKLQLNNNLRIKVSRLYSFAFFFWISTASFNFFSSSSRLIGLPFFFHSSQTVSGSFTRNGF
jgi:hypothetical protein